ncbi:DoxX family protein, partial [mine drainage metagenome]
WSYVVSIGELVLGIALIAGVFTGIAAFFGAFANVNYLLAGAVSTNPPLFLLQLVLVLAWRTAGWIGVDGALLPALGTPWRPGRLVRPPGGAPVATAAR